MVSIYGKVFQRKVVKVNFIIFSIIAAAGLYLNVDAASINWMPDSEPTVIESNISDAPKTPEIIGQKRCVMQRIAVQGQLNHQDVCFYHGTNLSYGYYRNIFYQSLPVIKYKYDSKAYPLAGVGYPDRTIIIPGTDTLLSFHYRSDSDQNFTLAIQKNVSRSLIKKQNNIGVLEYYALGDSNFKFIHDSLHYTWPVTAVNFSDNGKWLVAYVTNVGMLRFNLETGEIVRFSHIDMPYHAPLSGLLLSLAVSNDGKYAALGGYGTNVPFSVYTIDEECIEVFDNNWPNSGIPKMRNPCSSIELRQHTQVKVADYHYEKNISFSSDGGMINFFAYNDESRAGKWAEVLSSGYERPRLKYLAMGDSYSSGEGDTQVVQGRKFYLPGTDLEGDDETPREKCHVSSRSYPFLLKETMNLSIGDMKSVACSGARVDTDYTPSEENEDYHGQGERLAGFKGEIELKARALSMFTPGRVKQLEFIDKYKPQAITITGGGNDVGFGDVIKSCILSTYYSCSYNSTQPGRAAIGQGIASQYYELMALFSRIRELSPDTRIYIVGYPQFIDGASFFCAPNVPISQNERIMINESVTYLNRVIEAAAINSGVRYIDIEHSLTGHKLCEKGEAYVTGLALARKIGFGSTMIGSSEEQESFHPNKNGHALIAKAINDALRSQSLIDYDEYPTVPDVLQLTKSVSPPVYFAESMANATKHYKKGNITPREYVQKSSATDMFNVRFGGFEPHSQVRVENHSDPVHLGTFTTDANGFLSVSIPVPDNIPAGFHTLHLIGRSYSGEEVDIWQGIEVRGVSGDIDEDGIPDDVDECRYVTELGIDNDYDEIDDACDAMIGGDGRNQQQPEVVLVTGNGNKPYHAIERDNMNRGLRRSDTNMQQVIEDLFHLPAQKTKLESPELDKSSEDNGFYYLLGGVIISTLILIWAIKRYSNQ